jgi:uncharacterized protein YjbJ (UPF0337 family)
MKNMSTNRIEGATRKASGAIKQSVGKATGDDRLRAEGAAEKAVGSAQNAIGKAQDKLGSEIRR